MDSYLLIESTGSHGGPGAARFLADAVALARDGAQVALVLIQDGVTAALAGAADEAGELLREGGQLWVDDFSFWQRALQEADLIGGARLVGMNEIAGRLLSTGTRAVFH